MHRNHRVESRELGDGLILTQLDTGQHHGLNSVGALIWSLIDGQSFAELVEATRQGITDPPADLSEDMAEFLEALHKRRLVYLSRPEAG